MFYRGKGRPTLTVGTVRGKGTEMRIPGLPAATAETTKSTNSSNDISDRLLY